MHYAGAAGVLLHKWNVHNGKIEIIFFVVKFRSQQLLNVNVEVYVKVYVRRRPICICGILYFKLNGIDSINKITKPRFI